MSQELNSTQESSSPPNQNKLFEDILSIISDQSKTNDGKVNDEENGQEKTKNEARSQQKNPSADIMSALLSNPELLSKLPSLISSIKPIMELIGKSNLSSPSSQPAASITEEQEHTVSAKPQSKNDSDCRSALLCAMKPYLSSDRQNAIDYIIKLSRLGDILKTL